MTAVIVREVALDETLDLRTQVLRSHLPGLPSTVLEDQLPSTWHLGAFLVPAPPAAEAGGGPGSPPVGVVTGFPQEAPGHPGEPAQRFRFMAVAPAWQGHGVGTALIRAVVERARGRGDRYLWANGRDSALDFYARLGFAIVGERFQDTTSQLPHHVVLLEL